MSHRHCGICAFTVEHGHTPSGVNHCADCHVTWLGHAEGHCSSCHRHFGGDTAFRSHQADGICRDPSLLKTRDGEPRFRLVERKRGLAVWVQNDERLFPALGHAAGETSDDTAPAAGREPAGV